MAHYRFQSEWKLEAPIDSVFELLRSTEDLDRWWPSVTSARLLERGDESGVGDRAEYTLRSPLLYSMTFTTTATEVDRPHRIHALVRGDLVGTGTYELDEHDGATRVRLVWRVSTTKPWMNRMAPLARPIFVWAHNHVMREGAAAMASRLGAKLHYSKMRIEDEPSPVTQR